MDPQIRDPRFPWNHPRVSPSLEFFRCSKWLTLERCQHSLHLPPRKPASLDPPCNERSWVTEATPNRGENCLQSSTHHLSDFRKLVSFFVRSGEPDATRHSPVLAAAAKTAGCERQTANRDVRWRPQNSSKPSGPSMCVHSTTGTSDQPPARGPFNIHGPGSKGWRGEKGVPSNRQARRGAKPRSKKELRMWSSPLSLASMSHIRAIRSRIARRGGSHFTTCSEWPSKLIVAAASGAASCSQRTAGCEHVARAGRVHGGCENVPVRPWAARWGARAALRG